LESRFAGDLAHTPFMVVAQAHLTSDIERAEATAVAQWH
jgi:hypothetical protein